MEVLFDTAVSLKENILSDKVQTLSGAALATYTKPFQEFNKILNDVTKKIETYANTPKHLRQNYFKQEVRPLIHELNNKFLQIAKKKYSKERPFPVKQAKSFPFKEGAFYLSNTEEARKLSNILNKLQYMGKGLFILGIGVSAAGVVDSFRKGEDWKRELFNEIGATLGGVAGGLVGGVAGGLVVGGLSGLFFLPGVAGLPILITFAFAAGTAYGGAKFGGWLSDQLYEYINKCAPTSCISII